jgi:xanthine dehydrogenase accessory factor
VSGVSLGAALAAALAARERGEGAVIVNVTADRTGHFSSRSGRMVVFERSRRLGSIDRAVDSVVEETARNCLRERRSRMRSFQVDDEGARSLGAQGGNVDVFFEVLSRPPRIIIVGAGHIGVPLAHIATLLDFDVTVLDDRQEYANRERFPTANSILVGPYRETLATVPVDGDTFIVLVTRGHVHDLACLEEVVASGAAYIGMIGSKRRVRTVLDHAREHGADEEALRSIFAPVGLDIGAQTPQEIAVAVMAEIIRVRRGGTGNSLALREHVHR